MIIRFYSLLLILGLLVLIAACSTSPTQPIRIPEAEPQQPTETGTIESEPVEVLPGYRLNPSTRSLSEVIELSKTMSFYQQDLALEIVRSLESISSSQLRTMIEGQSYDPEFTEWLELALQVRTVMINGSAVSAAAEHWANYHYGHPVSRMEFQGLVSDYSSFYPTPSHVAVLLPTEGGLAAAAGAIRDGIMSAYLDHPGNATLRFYPSGDNGESAIAAYLQAREDGATQIVGPLSLDSTRALARLADSSVPILLLNRAESDQSDSLEKVEVVNSLSLSQTEEATSIAESVLDQGQSRAIVMVPDSDWGRRIETAFETAFKQGGGLITVSAQFDRAKNDYSAMLTKLLKIDESERRKSKLQAQLGAPLSFEPTRRVDFDFIFMAASPQEGRELKPLLRFYDAGEVPVYSIDRVYSGLGEEARDQDLNDIVFTTVPWYLKTDVTKDPIPASVRGGSLGKLYALGLDAWHLLPWLPLMQKDADLWFPGNVGALKLLANGQIYRQPAWAQFFAGQVLPYQWPNRH